MAADRTLSNDDLDPAAGGGLLHRRVFMRRGLVLSTALAADAALALPPEAGKPADAAGAADPPPWTLQPGLPFTEYGQPSAALAWTRGPPQRARPGPKRIPAHSNKTCDAHVARSITRLGLGRLVGLSACRFKKLRDAASVAWRGCAQTSAPPCLRTRALAGVPAETARRKPTAWCSQRNPPPCLQRRVRAGGSAPSRR